MPNIEKLLEDRRLHEVPCRIEAAELKVSRGEGTTYKATATYRYEFRQRTYQNDQVSFHAGSDNVGSFHQDVHRELSRHLQKNPSAVEIDPAQVSPPSFRCYVNPDDPSQAVLYRDLRWQMQAFMAIFALTFPAVGAGLMVAGISGARSLKRESALRSQHPQEPWKWKTAWQGESIPETRGITTNAVHLYTLWSGLIIVPLLAATAQTGAFQIDGTAWLLLIFVVLWAIPVSFSLKRLRHKLAIGKARFEPEELPAWPGGVLRGHLLFDKPLPMRSAADLSLYCEKTTSRGSGEDRKTTVEKIWSHHQSILQNDSTGLHIRNRLGPISWKSQFEKSRIIGFAHDSNMSSGNTSYYRVRLESVIGKKTTLADGIDGSSTAAALIERLELWRNAR